MTLIAVAGGSGYVGRRLVAACRDEGLSVRVLARLRTAGPLPWPDVELIKGDIRDMSSVARLVAGADVAVHLAASVSPADEPASINVRGTDELVRASLQAGVKRVVFVGCMGASADAHDAFYQSKWEAEIRVRAREADIETVVLRPGPVVGPDDNLLTPLAALIRRLPVLPLPRDAVRHVQPIDADDLVRCILAAMESNTLPGRTVDVGGPLHFTFGEVAEFVSRKVGIERATVGLPSRLMPALVALAPDARPLLNSHRIAAFQQNVVSSPGIVNSVFGFQPRSLVHALDDYLPG